MTKANLMPEEKPPIRVCIIDDDKEVIGTVERILGSDDYETMGITEAFGSSNKVRKFNPHIIILDINMPALDGHNLFEVFQKTLPHMPKVILFSGIAPGELEEIALDIQADDFVYKGDGYFRLLNRVKFQLIEMSLCGQQSRA